METAKQFLQFAKEKEKRRQFEEALMFYRKAMKALDIEGTPQIRKLEQKIKNLEGIIYQNAASSPLSFDDANNISSGSSNTSSQNTSRSMNSSVDEEMVPQGPLFLKPSAKPAKVVSSSAIEVKASTDVAKHQEKKQKYEDKMEEEPPKRTMGDLIEILNNGTLGQLCELKGVGEKRGNAIIASRPYRHPHDLLKVAGFGKKFVSGMVDQFLADEESEQEED
jgi:DNA uptake protein ComE-like DNA-binding protein